MHQSIRILNQIEVKDPLLVAAWPGMGNVAFGAAMYLKESLKALKFAEIQPQDFFFKTGVQITDGIIDIPELPRNEFFWYKAPRGISDLIIFLGESQPVMEREYGIAQRVVEVALYYRVKEIITFAATPVNITHRDEPGVWGVATERSILERLPALGVKTMSAGHIGGLNGLLLGVGKEAGIGGLCLLGEIPFYTAKIENPKSSLAVLKVFTRYISIRLDFNGLIQMARFVEEEVEKVSKATRQTIFGEEPKRDVKESGEAEEVGGSVEDKTVTREVRERIEYLFEAATKDISRAGELKKELDRWGLFQDYEDRFLDLFGKRHL
ncbi:MAG: PAC2 family protein [Spirochaetota bacterium]